ncbi:lasso peptide biosynthesis B2 protein [Deinococcus sp.]|uniref:lasso peptide biosynthesis B2 protein n=1 Tax=Deinococcus sp. TaxID=47478 RepID=UPI003CC66000
MTLDPLHLALTDPAQLGPQDALALLGAGLGGAVLARLPRGHALAPLLAPQRLALLARHMRIKAALIPLLAAWHAAGIKAVLLKGFASAEFVYPDPSQRFYGDVDVLIDERDAVRAARFARELGWADDGLVSAPRDWTHEVAHLYSPDGETRLDVHRRVAPTMLGTGRKVRRATRHLRDAAQLAQLGPAAVWLPDPRDSVIMLALTRGWSGEAGLLKPADPLDLDMLYRKHRLNDAAVLERAATLGCLHTVAATLRACRAAKLADTQTGRRIRLGVLLDLHPTVNFSGKKIGRLLRLPAVLTDVWHVLPDALRVRRAIRQGGDPRELPARWRQGTSARVGYVSALRAIRGANWALRLLYPGGATCVPRSLTRYAALSRAGVPVAFVSGVRRTEAGLESHAWIELPPALDSDFGEPEARRLYRELFRHQAESS